MRAALLLLAACSTLPRDRVYPQTRYCTQKVKATIDSRTAWIVDEHDWLSSESGALTVEHDDVDLGRPCAVGFVDRPLGIWSGVRAGDRVLIPWVDSAGHLDVARRTMRTALTFAELSPRAVGAPVLRDCGECYPPTYGGLDAVVGVVSDTTAMVGVDELAFFVKDRVPDPIYNLAINEGLSW